MKTLLVLLLVIAADTDSKPRKASSIAPSLPALSKEEESKIEDIIERFIRADTGRLRGAEARKAIDDLEKLKPEAIPALIRGLNQAARSNQTCPVLTISQKLRKMLLASDDQILLEYARDEIGADIRQSRHAGTLRSLRLQVTLRKNALSRLAPSKTTRPAPKTLAQMSTTDLVKAASSKRGEELRGIIGELSKRDGKEALGGLAVAASSSDSNTRKLAHEGMDLHLGKLSATALSPYLESDSAEVRRGAVRAAAKHTRLVRKVIDAVEDDSAEVRAEARAALKALSKGKDFGPSADASTSERGESKRQWLAWWQQQK